VGVTKKLINQNASALLNSNRLGIRMNWYQID